MLPFLALGAPPPTHSLVIGGDIMLNGVRVGSGPLAGVATVFRRADFALANLEVPLTDARMPTATKTAAELKARTQFVLKADPRHIGSLKGAGFDLVGLANNHAMDYGAAGLAQERSLLAKAGIRATGAGPTSDVASSLVISEKNGFRVGLLAALAFMGRGALRKCSPAGPDHAGVNVLSFDGKIDEAAREKLQSWIGSARNRCDYLIVAFHWGIERQTKPTAYQIALGRAAVDAGADLVWGAHPHVLQPTETYHGAPILYSTGNLISPLPGRTALYRMSIGSHKTYSLQQFPVVILSGKAKLSRPTFQKRSAKGRNEKKASTTVNRNRR